MVDVVCVDASSLPKPAPEMFQQADVFILSIIHLQKEFPSELTVYAGINLCTQKSIQVINCSAFCSELTPKKPDFVMELDFYK